MGELYRLGFGFSRSRKYAQAVEIANLAYQHEVSGEGEEAWHSATFTEEQLDLVAALFDVSSRFSVPLLMGADLHRVHLYCLYGDQFDFGFSGYRTLSIRKAALQLQAHLGMPPQKIALWLDKNYIQPLRLERERIRKRLIESGYLGTYDPHTGEYKPPQNQTGKPVPAYLAVRRLIEQERYAEAIERYYAVLRSRDYSEYHSELLYLKRLASSPLLSRDLICFRHKTQTEAFLARHLVEYRNCIDAALAKRRAEGRPLPHEVLMAHVPTLEQAIERRRLAWHNGVWLREGKIERSAEPVTIRTLCWSNDRIRRGRLFEVYPDPVACCQVAKYPRDRRGCGLWITYCPEFIQRHVLDKGWHVRFVDAYSLVAWRGPWNRDPSFMTALALRDLVKQDNWAEEIEFTGRIHCIEDKTFYEVNLVRPYLDGAPEAHNPFLEVVEEVLREGEDILRTRHGLPPIGKTGISEALLFSLVQQHFPDAERHATFDWLRPQHLDIWIPSLLIGIEYQGAQHYEPVAFFGGGKALETTGIRDRRKANKCADNGVVLIHWKHDEPLTESGLRTKIEQATRPPPKS